MEIAFYQDHHFLPFNDEARNPDYLYDPSNIKSWTYQDDNNRTRKASSHYMMPILRSLYALNLPNVMAHVSLIMDRDTKTIKSCKRVWIRITTMPADYDGVGLPIIVKNGVMQVNGLWGYANNSYRPHQLLGDQPVPGEKTARFWSKYFLERLAEEKAEVEKDLWEATESVVAYKNKLDLYNSIGI